LLFNSYEFIFLFLPISLYGYFWLNKRRLVQAGKAWLVLSSLFFYSWWNIVYLPLILGSIFFNFAIGSTLSQKVASEMRGKSFSARTLLAFGIVSNLTLLGYFKYTDFFITNINAVAGSHFDLLHILLPLGISFFTFTQIAYLVDAYRGEAKEMDYLNYTLFVTFFPHLLAGPILHHKEMMPQFDAIKSKVFNYKNSAMGLFLFSIGLFKKVVIADTFSIWANAGFEATQALTLFEAWATSLSYTFQLYFDFSGYTDMALGVALMFNIRLPINFNSP
jgi:D-alanyl-lipoteichoic acid acyltransferase DltB (MBOAT superfamily)